MDDSYRMSIRKQPLGHDGFIGKLQMTRSLNGITLSHRIATVLPEEIREHSHTEPHFMFITGGRYISSARSQPHRSTNLVYNPPMTTHHDHFFEGRGSFFSICLPENALASYTETALPAWTQYVSGDSPCGLVRALLMECARWDSSSALKAESLCVELFCRVNGQPQRQFTTRPRWLQQAYEIIQDTFSVRTTVSELAAEVRIHPAHLTRAFRCEFGCTPGDLLRSRRLEKAAELLSVSKSSISDIALDTGFADQAQFTKAFRSVYGATPGMYKANQMRPALADVGF